MTNAWAPSHEISASDREFWPSTPGALTASTNHHGVTWLTISGYPGWANIRPLRGGTHLIALRQGPGQKIHYTHLAGPPTVVRSLAETMLTAAARAAGIEAHS
jgi:hypothetical protein